MTRHPVRRFLAWLLTFALLASGGTTAVAQAGTTPTAGLIELVICTADGGTTTIQLDRNGEPVDPAEPCPAHDCPACVLAPLAGLEPPAGWPGPSGALARRGPPAAQDILPSRHCGRGLARAPPLRA